jgi:hypothetical protein
MSATKDRYTPEQRKAYSLAYYAEHYKKTSLFPTSHREAIRKGTKFYFTGKVCKHGHISRRFTDKKGCEACVKLKKEKKKLTTKQRYAERLKKLQKQAMGWRQARLEDMTPEQIKARRAYQLKHNYGLTYEEYEKMLVDQNQMCAICNKPFDESRTFTSPAVEHDHTTMKVRGIVHQRCNVMLGYAQEDTTILQGAIRYIRRNNQ